jgi:Amidohydrolase
VRPNPPGVLAPGAPVDALGRTLPTGQHGRTRTFHQERGGDVSNSRWRRDLRRRWPPPLKLTFGSDYAIWHPRWIIEDFINFELPADLKQEYGIDLTLAGKRKILGENAARLYGVDIQAHKRKLAAQPLQALDPDQEYAVA